MDIKQLRKSNSDSKIKTYENNIVSLNSPKSQAQTKKRSSSKAKKCQGITIHLKCDNFVDEHRLKRHSELCKKINKLHDDSTVYYITENELDKVNMNNDKVFVKLMIDSDGCDSEFSSEDDVKKMKSVQKVGSKTKIKKIKRASQLYPNVSFDTEKKRASTIYTSAPVDDTINDLNSTNVNASDAENDYIINYNKSARTHRRITTYTDPLAFIDKCKTPINSTSGESVINEQNKSNDKIVCESSISLNSGSNQRVKSKSNDKIICDTNVGCNQKVKSKFITTDQQPKQCSPRKLKLIDIKQKPKIFYDKCDDYDYDVFIIENDNGLIFCNGMYSHSINTYELVKTGYVGKHVEYTFDNTKVLVAIYSQKWDILTYPIYVLTHFKMTSEIFTNHYDNILNLTNSS